MWSAISVRATLPADVLRFAASAATDFSRLHTVQPGGDVVLTIDAHVSVTLSGATLAAVTSHRFIFR
jgi:hypothetical protein